MAISAAIQTLSAAFSFGILLQAATGALLIYFKGHGSTIFKDGRRLVLVLFLLFAALWAQVDFLNLLILKPLLCQATLIFSTAFDQMARFLVEQFLLWSVVQGTKSNAGQVVLQAILGLRLIAGGVLVGFTRPDFAPVCVARTLLEPVGIVVVALDFVIIGVLLIRLVSLGIFRDMRDSRSSTRDQSKGLVLTVVGFIVWTATSVAMILGIPTIELIVRTVVPSNGLLILVGILTFSAGSLLETREQITTPEAHSPLLAPSVPTREIFREEVGNGSPIVGHNYTKSGSLFVVKPSSTPRDSPTAAQGYFQGNAPGFSKLGREVTVTDLDANSPAPRNIPGYRGSSGVFPTIVTNSMYFEQGALPPQIRANVVDSTRNVPMPSVPPPTAQQKRSLFNRSKQPAKPDIRSLKISKPVMNEDNGSFQQPFARMQTIDLAQAAENERERREAAADRSRLVANRPAPPRPEQFTLPAEKALRKSVSVKRKEMPVSQPRQPMPTIASSSSSALSVDAANGGTTSASLSPGHEEVRRRSPRNANSFANLIDQKAKPLPTLQRKQTIGLPSNPRTTRIAPGPSMAKEQTVMLMNNIVYDNPGIVKTIIKVAPDMYAAAQKAKASEKSPTASYTTDLKSSGSIIHRPRPYRKNSEKDRALFPSEPSPRHRRTKSGSSITTRKSVLMSHPGSPTQLPPLPAPPTSAAKLKRLLPNDTKSMTFDEKIQLLFPAPPETSIVHNRRSSVPSLPRVPSVFMSETPLTQSPTQEEQASRRASKRTTIASFTMPDIPAQTAKEDTNKGQERQTFRFSANTYRTLADQVGETWIPGIPIQEVNMGGLVPYVTDMDSHILQNTRKSHMTDVSSSNVSTEDDSTTYWGSIHSEIPRVDLSKVMRNANSTFIQRSRAGTLDELKPPPPKTGESNNGGEIMTVMLVDSEENCQSVLLLSADNRQSFFLDADQALPGDKTPTTGKAWHRRIGDELPTFTQRKASTKTRKMPAPTPLLLNQRGRGATVVVRAAEPSPPAIDSPARAIAEIQAQLNRFEEPSRGSVGSLLRRIPDAASRENDATDEDRLRLLENLENEMGQQENQWQQMHTNLDRDSMSTINTVMTHVSPVQSESGISRESSQRSSRTPSRVVSRRARIRSSMTLRSKGDESTCTTSTQSSDNSRASIWQQRLAEAQMEYMENAPALLRKRSVNFLSVSKSHQLGSPTPPHSDSGTDIDTDSEVESEPEHTSFSAPKEPVSLWQAQLPSPKAAVGRMWNPPYEMVARVASSEPPAKSIRPLERQIRFPLSISSSELWSKPASLAHSRPVVGLWGSRLVRPVSIRTRPVTQRPPRRSKRVTFLPDIIESPVPLPNKRDTLGIFQFPWGETSDSAVYQPAFNPALLSGPILTAKLGARSRQLEPESEYSSSFFDDYDEDMDEDGESDDDFDETTLWEIANLLKSENVPSKNSLLPPPREVIEDYDDEEETDFEDDEEVEEVKAQRPVTKLPIMPLAIMPKEEFEEQSKEESLLWATGLTSALEAATTHLPQPEPQVWQMYVPSSDSVVRSKPRPAAWLPTLASQGLWPISESEGTSLSASPMWSGTTTPKVTSSTNSIPYAKSTFMWAPKPEQVEVHSAGLFSLDAQQCEVRTTQAKPAASLMVRTPRPINTSLPVLSSQSLWAPRHPAKKVTVWTSKPISQKAKAQTMWAPSAKIASAVIVGLFSTTHSRSSYRPTTLTPAAQNMTLKPRSSLAPLPQLTSHSLWRLSSLPYEHHWISESSIRPTSPSVYSESSGRSSPTSETSSISGASLKSTSTKASSIWGSIKSASTPIWWDSNGARKTPSPPPNAEDENTRFASRLPLLKPVAERKLEPVRESKVLASRDLWEAKAPVSLGETPKRNFRNSTAVKKELHVEEQPLKKQYQRPASANTNWHEALAEAIALGTRKKTLSKPVASEADWEAALAEAVSKGKARVERPKATPEMWNAALAEAIVGSAIPTPAKIQHYDPAVHHPVFFTESLVSSAAEVHPAAIGYVKTVSQYDPTVRHPVFFAKSLVSTAADIHPAATGHVEIIAQYDPAVLHPVFFTTSLISSIADSHPTAIGHVVRPLAKTMWTAPFLHVAALESPIGPMWLKGKVASSQFEHDITETKRSAPISRSTNLPTLESTSIWHPAQLVQVKERNWIAAAKMTRALTWTVPKVVDEEESKNMWTPNNAVAENSTDLFAHMKGEHIKKASVQPAMLPRLNSSELFTPASISSKDDTHWLHTTSTSISRNAPSAGMWMAPKKVVPSKKNEPDMFRHLKSEPIKKVTSTRPAVLARLNSSELFAAGSSTENATHWLHSTSSSSTSTPLPSAPASPKLPSALLRSQTWTAPRSTVSAQQDGSSMWSSPATQLAPVKKSAIFENPHNEPWCRKKRSDSGVQMEVGLESREMWSRKWSMLESPKEWLMMSEKRASKVQFRY